MGSGTGEEQASRGRKRACLVPVSIADEVTKTILNSPKALTASSDRCYCPQQSNTTVWIRRSKNKNDKKRVYREDTQSSVEVQTDTQTRGRAGNLVMFRPGIGRRERTRLPRDTNQHHFNNSSLRMKTRIPAHGPSNGGIKTDAQGFIALRYAICLHEVYSMNF